MQQAHHSSVVGWPHGGGGSIVPAPISSFFASVQPNQGQGELCKGDFIIVSILHYWHSVFFLSHIDSPLSSIESPPPTSSQQFFLGDALRGFFAIGQFKSPYAFCARNQAHSNKMTWMIKNHNVLKQILDRRLADTYVWNKRNPQGQAGNQAGEW